MIEAMWRQRLASGRAWFGLAAGLALLAVIALSTGLRSHPTHRVRLVDLPAQHIVPLDPAGCPEHVRCRATGAVPAEATRAVIRHFPAARAQWQVTTSAASGQVFRQQAVYLLGPGDTLLVNSECEPGGTRPGVRRSSSSAQQRSDLAGNQIALISLYEIVVPGRPGCSTELLLTVAGDGLAEHPKLLALAAEPAVGITG